MKSKLRKMVNKTKTQAVVSRKANLKTKLSTTDEK